MKIKKIFYVLLGLCISLTIGRIAYAEGIVTIGVIGPMSGSAAAWGLGMHRGVELAIEDINNAGGVKVGNDVYKLKSVVADDKYSGSVAISEAGRMIFDQKIKYVIGPIGSSPTVAISPIMNENKILMLCNSFTPRALNEKLPYNFRALGSTSHEIAPVIWSYVKKKYGVKTAVLLGQNDETGEFETEDDVKACNALGIKVIHKELYDLNTKDFMPLMTKVYAMNPDAIEIGCGATGFLAQMAKALYELGYKGVMVSNSGAGEAEVVVAMVGKEALEGLVSSNVDYSADYVSPWMREFRQRVLKKYGPPFSMLSAWAYWPTMMLKDAMEKTGSLDTDKLKAYFEVPGKKFMHIWGETEFGGKQYYGVNRQIKVHVPVTEIRDGKNVLVQAPQIPPLEH